ncbi:MAG: hypothetical protein R3C42_07165 [Parvularculaceae bacterium]
MADAIDDLCAPCPTISALVAIVSLADLTFRAIQAMGTPRGEKPDHPAIKNLAERSSRRHR